MCQTFHFLYLPIHVYVNDWVDGYPCFLKLAAVKIFYNFLSDMDSFRISQESDISYSQMQNPLLLASSVVSLKFLISPIFSLY